MRNHFSSPIRWQVATKRPGGPTTTRWTDACRTASFPRVTLATLASPATRASVHRAALRVRDACALARARRQATRAPRESSRSGNARGGILCGWSCVDEGDSDAGDAGPTDDDANPTGGDVDAEDGGPGECGRVPDRPSRARGARCHRSLLRKLVEGAARTRVDAKSHGWWPYEELPSPGAVQRFPSETARDRASARSACMSRLESRFYRAPRRCNP